MVTYNRTTWVDGSTGGTPLNATRLNNLETAVAAMAPLVSEGGSAATGNLVTVVETASGYPISVSAANTFYRFVGLATPPFQRAGDSWDKVDLGFVPDWRQVFVDGFDAAVGTGGNVALSTTDWGGDTTFFAQRNDGLLICQNWSGSTTRYGIFSKTAATSKMALEFSHINLSGNTTAVALSMFVNVSDPTAVGTATTGYRLGWNSLNGTATFTVHRFDAGVATQIGSNFTEPDANVARPVTIRVESDGAGKISYLRGGTVINVWQDPATTKLTGLYAGLGGVPVSSSLTPSMAARGDQFRLYGK